MKLAHNVTVSVFCYDLNKVEAFRSAMEQFLPDDWKDQKIIINEKSAVGFEDQKIVVFDLFLEKKKHIKVFLKKLRGLLGSELEVLRKTIYKRVDENCNLFIRLDREAFLAGKAALTYSGDCFHIKINIAAFPKKKEAAESIAIEMFK